MILGGNLYKYKFILLFLLAAQRYSRVTMADNAHEFLAPLIKHKCLNIGAVSGSVLGKISNV